MSGVIAGIDPGLTGAVALLDDLGVTIHSMPVVDKRIEGKRLWWLLEHASLVVCERVWGSPEWGATNFVFGSCWGGVIAVVSAMSKPLLTPTPSVWKKEILSGTAKDKQAAITYVQQRWPDLCLTPAGKSKPSHDWAEAVCLAEYGRRVLGGTS